MSENVGDPFAESDPWDGADDEFETAKTEWLRLEDLDGRLVVIDVLKLGTKKGDDGPYPYAEANVLVIDGPPLGELLPAVPGVVERMHIVASGVLPQIEGFAGKHKPFLARLDSVPSKRNKNIKVMGVRKHEITPEDKVAALPVWRKYLQDNTFA
jgi:hypothetical protein